MRAIEIITGDNDNFIDGWIGNYYFAVSRDLDIVGCGCLSSDNNNYCEHTGYMYRLKFGKEAYIKFYLNFKLIQLLRKREYRHLKRLT